MQEITASPCDKCCNAMVVEDRIPSLALRWEDFRKASREEVMLEQMLNHALVLGQNDRIETSDGGESICKHNEGILEITRKLAMSRTGPAVGSTEDRVEMYDRFDTEVFCKSIYRVWT